MPVVNPPLANDQSSARQVEEFEPEPRDIYV